MSADLPFTGERFVPGTKGEIWVEHWHRYHFAARWARGKRVLDVACGEGYGTALLARTAAHATGIDISAEAVAHAARTYGGLGNCTFARAPCTRLPLADGSIDLAVSFETLEHIAEQAEFLDELARVLAPGGVLILSCPNKLEYSDKRGFTNEFHVRELYREELAALLGPRFPQAAWYGQRPSFFSVIAPEAAERAEAQLVETSEVAPQEASGEISNPLYFLVVASRMREALDAPAPALSVLADRDDWVHKDYEKVMRWLEESARHGRTLQERLDAREADLAAMRARATELDAALAAAAGEGRRIEALVAAHQAEIAARDREIDRRRGWRWWLKLPLIRLGLLE